MEGLGAREQKLCFKKISFSFSSQGSCAEWENTKYFKKIRTKKRKKR